MLVLCTERAMEALKSYSGEESASEDDVKEDEALDSEPIEDEEVKVEGYHPSLCDIIFCQRTDNRQYRNFIDKCTANSSTQRRAFRSVKVTTIYTKGGTGEGGGTEEGGGEGEGEGKQNRTRSSKAKKSLKIKIKV